MLPQHAISVILARCVLHNFLRQNHCQRYCPAGYADTMDADGTVADGGWRNDNLDNLGGINPTVCRNPTTNATAVRDKFIDYFSGERSLAWQVAHVNRV